MLSFGNLEQSILSPIALATPQRYLYDKEYDLCSQKKSEIRSDVVSTTLPYFSEKESILSERDLLLEQRGLISNCWFLGFRKSKLAQINLIDKQIDLLDDQLIVMQEIERENMMSHTKKVMARADALLQRING